ncbi:hypothetical protein [Rhizobium metallidurans]|uniref:DUF3829 domain-containing protein n=1 Tax=Rhizobium metallidurans TaxID=1265931 RepID=A0A7W6GDB7_9HYPH|nr:hypothetical protein [Rhizobium metallidurans]MBB3966910.1 hypothetical protein [Rhizobium metallidurans]
MLRQLRVLALLATSMLVACASVDAEDIQEFGAATTAVADAARNTGAMRSAIGQRLAVEQQALLFALGDTSSAYPPPKAKPSPVDAEWSHRIAFAQALSEYGAALAKAAAGVAGDDLGNALGNLQKAVGDAIPGTAKTKNFQPVADTTVLVARKVITELQYRRIQLVIEKAHPSIVKGRALLAADFALMADNIDAKYSTWERQQAAVLKQIRGAPDANSPADVGVRYRSYRDFLKERQEMEAAFAPFLNIPGERPRYEVLLDRFVAAHKELAENKPNPLTLERFIEAVKELQAAVKPFLPAKG